LTPGIPWTISSFIEIHAVAGKPYKPKNAGLAPSPSIYSLRKLSISFVHKN
jgi:hypothetical protein